MDGAYKLECQTCKQMKYDTGFDFAGRHAKSILDTSKCLDCKHPNRWDEIKDFFDNKFMDHKEKDRIKIGLLDLKK